MQNLVWGIINLNDRQIVRSDHCEQLETPEENLDFFIQQAMTGT